jgi:phosphate transport system substrate-binding protein
MLVAASVVLAFVTVSHAADITGAGATFPYPIYARWADAYSKESGIALSYQGIGSGGGVKVIKARAVTFGATDHPLTAEELEAAGLTQFPMVLGGVVPVANIKGIASGRLVLDGSTLAAIYLGDITTWNDPRISKLNPGLTLPSAAIKPVYRADGSGSNYLFTYYLSQESPPFRERVGAGTAVQWPAGTGSKGCEGVVNVVDQIPGAIGYVEYAYARQSQLTQVSLINRAGRRVAPSLESFQAAATAADWSQAPGYDLILTDQPGEASWPITGASFILLPTTPPDTVAAAAALRLFDWAYRHGQMATELDYAPLPESLIQSVRATWISQIKATPFEPAVMSGPTSSAP